MLTFPVVITVNYLGNPDNGVILAGYVGQLADGGRLPRDQLHDLGDDAQPGDQLHHLGGDLPLPDPGGLPAGDRPAGALGQPVAGADVIAAFSVMTHFEGFQKGVLDSRDIIFFLSLIGFSLFTTGVILRSHRAG